MPNLNSPSRKPGSDESMSGVFALGFRKEMLDVDDMMPARIVSWDSDTNRAQVEILYLVTMTDSSVHPMLAPAEVPTLVAGAGDLVLVWPLKPGDLGWIKSNDRDISLFLQEYNAQPGNLPRIHSFEDAIFIPDAMKDFIVTDADAVSLQTKDGTTSVQLKPGSIKFTVGDCVTTITASGTVSNKPIMAPQFTNGTVNLIGHIHSDSSGDTIGPARNP